MEGNTAASLKYTYLFLIVNRNTNIFLTDSNSVAYISFVQFTQNLRRFYAKCAQNLRWFRTKTMRKKTTVDVTDADAAANLQEDEEIVLQETRTIRKNKRTPTPELKPDPEMEFEDDNEDYGETVDVSPFKPGTIAHKLWQRTQNPDQADEDNEIAELGTGNILIVRKPDSPLEKFLKPCTSRISMPPLRNVDFSEVTEPEIEEMVRLYYGGGHYYLQFQIGSRMLMGWSCSLSDSPDAVREAAAERYAQDHPAQAPLVIQQPVNQLQQRIDELKLEREYDDLKFGPERERLRKLETEIEELRRERQATAIATAAAAIPQAKQSESMLLLEKALTIQNPTLQQKIIDQAFPSDEGSTHWAVDLFKTVMENKEELAQAAGALLGGIMPQPKAIGLETLLKSQPPGTLPPAPQPRSNLQRHRPAPIDKTGENIDDGSIGKNADTGPSGENLGTRTVEGNTDE